MKRLLQIALCAAAVTGILTANAGERTGDFALIDHEGAFHHMAWYDDNNAIVIFTHASGAAEAASTLAEIQVLQSKYENQGVVFFALNPGLQTDRAAAQADAAAMGINLPVLMDDTQLVSESLGFTRLGEAVVYNPASFEVLYRGPVAEQLENVLQQVLAGNIGDIVEVASSGTQINYLASNTQAALSYETDIAPIIAENCASCHRDGGIAPFAMDSHLAIQGWSPMIKEVVMTKRMPPGQVDNKVGHKVKDAMNLSDVEIQKLVHWIDQGSIADTDNDPLTALVWPETKWARGEPDLIVAIPPQSIPATGVVDYLNVVVELDLDKDVWVRGSQIIAGEPSALHHVLTGVIPPEGRKSQQEIFMQIVNSLPPEKARPIQQMLMAAVSSGESLDFGKILNSLPPEADISALFSGSQDADSASIAGYASGAPGQWNEPGVGGLLRAGSSLDLQLHYTTTGKELTDASEVGIYFYPEGEVPTQRTSGAIANNFNISIPAGAKDHEMIVEVTVHEDAYLQSFLPHMHFRGKRMKFKAIYPDGSEELLLSVPNYSFNWQLNHMLEEPLLVPAGTKIQAIGAFDNSAQNAYNPDPDAEIFWGEQSWQEMFMGFYSWKNADQGGSD
ncbi:MAG: hypothetical protein COA96_14485 [SAR86 cluster bacterium]|uniref:Cytochrome c domain-containing protein n=1 Tax=SAR86 cluster bacterium TaxID=2030880 RepID=A0A2A5AT56_9GAMM|nr:MAG: hypothetical protein COA96_14485 [SAR86 cluster bacterium]